MKLLMVFHIMTYPPESGVTKRTYHLLEEMARRHEVTLVSFGSPKEEESIRKRLGDRLKRIIFVDGRRPRWRSLLKRIELAAKARSLLQHSVTPKMQQALDEAFAGERFDLVFLGTPIFTYYRIPSGAPRITDTHNVEYDLHYRAYQQANGPLEHAYYWYQYKLLRRDELTACSGGDALLTTSARDKEVFLRDLPRQNIHVIPNGVDLDFFTPPPGEPEPYSMVFCGMMDWQPNDQGMCWFLDKVFPIIRSKEPRATLTIVGSRPSAALQKRATEGVTITGYVEDVRPPVARGQVYVVPLLVGGGTRLKAVEAMSMKKAIVTTSVGCEGIDLRQEESALFADQPEAFANAVLRLFGDAPLRSRLAERAQAIAREHYGWDTIGTQLDVVCRSLVPEIEQAKTAVSRAV